VTGIDASPTSTIRPRFREKSTLDGSEVRETIEGAARKTLVVPT
jgi:hypothetical protein